MISAKIPDEPVPINEDSELINTIRCKISDKINKFQQISKELSRPVQFLQYTNENEINSQLSDIFYDVASILYRLSVSPTNIASIVNTIPPELQKICSYTPKIKQMRDSIEGLSFDIEDQSIRFDDTLTTIRQTFSERQDSIQKDYQTQIARIVIDNSNEEEQLEKDLYDLQIRLAKQLDNQFSSERTDKEEIRRKSVALNVKGEENSSDQSKQIPISVSPTSFSLGPPGADTQISSNADNSSSSNEILFAKQGRARGMAITKTSPSISRDRLLKRNHDFLNDNENDFENSNSYENNATSSSQYYDENSEQNEEEEYLILSNDSYDNFNSNQLNAYQNNLDDLNSESNISLEIIPNECEKTDISYYNKRSETAKLEQKKLNDELFRLQNFYTREKKRLHELIEQKTQDSVQIAQKQLSKQFGNHQRRTRQLDGLFQKREKELQQKIVHVEQSKKEQNDKLKKEIEEKKKVLKATEQSFKNEIKKIKNQTQTEIQKRNEEIQALRAKNQKEIDDFQKEEVVYSIREPDSIFLNSPRRAVSHSSLTARNFNGTFGVTEKGLNNENRSVERAIRSIEEQFRITNQIIRNTIEMAKLNLIDIEKKKENTSLKIENLKKIQQVKNSIRNCTNENVLAVQSTLEEYKNNHENIEKVPLSIIQDEMKEELKEKKEQYDAVKKLFEDLELNIASKYQEAIKEEEISRQNQIKQIQIELQNATQRLNEISRQNQQTRHKHQTEKVQHAMGSINMEPKCIKPLPLLKH